MRTSFHKLFIVMSLALIAVTGASAQYRDRDRDRNDGDRYKNTQTQQEARWRVRRSGRYYTLNQSQADILRQAVNAGYQQGYQAGRENRQNRRRGNYRTMSVYREGSYGYQSSVDRNLYSYYFQQGFQRGYQDGYSSRFRYGRDEGGTVNILGNIVNSMLNLQRY